MNAFSAGFPAHSKIGPVFWGLAVPVTFWGAAAALLFAFLYHWARYASLPVH